MRFVQGAWRRNEDDEYKVFVRGKEEKKVGTVVEIHTRSGDINYIVIKGTHSKFKGGYLYEFRYISKPKRFLALDTNLPNLPEVSSVPYVNTSSIKPKEVSAEDLDKALGLD